MKLLVFFLAMAVISQPNTQVEYNTHQIVQQDHKREVDPKDLPETVTIALEESEYSAWTMEKAYQLTTAEEPTFELHLVQEEQTVVLLVDSKGHLQLKTDS